MDNITDNTSGIKPTHTPGPWEQDDNIVGAAEGGMHICTVTSSDDFPCITDDDEQTEAEARAAVDIECACNARLIAAAPDLLAAAQLLEKAEDAHAHCDECEGEEIPELCPKCFPLFDDARVKRRNAIAKALA